MATPITSITDLGTARTPSRWWQHVGLAGLACLPVAVYWLGGVDGWMWSGAFLALAMIATVASRVVAISFGLLLRHGRGEPGLVRDDPNLPRYTILIPLYHEAAVVPHLLASLTAIQWPRDRLESLLLVEVDDHETRAALEAAKLPAWMHIVVVPDGRPRTKPRACNVGLEQATGDLLVVFDAEDRPDPDQLLCAAAAFRRHPPHVACLQARLQADHRGHGLPALGFAVDYAVWFDLYLPGLHAVGAPIPLGGTSNHFRTASLRSVGGWDAWNVTEDADLGVRLARHGLRTALIDSTTWEEAPSQWLPWLRQRSRWMKGWWQTMLVHTRQPLALVRDLGWWRTAWWMATIPGQVLAALALPVCWVLLGIGLVRGCRWADPDRPWTATLLAAGVALVLINLLFLVLSGLAAWRRGHRLGALLSPLLPLYWLAVSWAAWRGVLQCYTDPFRWEKTPHGAGLISSAVKAVPGNGPSIGQADSPWPSESIASGPQRTTGHRWSWRIVLGAAIALGVTGIAITAVTAPTWSGFVTEVDRRRIDPQRDPNAVVVMTPDTSWIARERLEVTITLATPAERALPVRLTAHLVVLDGTWFQYEGEATIPSGAATCTVALPLHADGWLPVDQRSIWCSDWLRRVREAGVRVWLPSGMDLVPNIQLTCAGAHPPPALAIRADPAPGDAATRQRSEWRFRLTRAYDNPFDPDLIEAWADIEAPDGTVRRAEAFAFQDYQRHMEDGSEVLDVEGGPCWAVRFTPNRAGEHLIRFHARDHQGDSADSEAMSMTVRTGTGQGFVRTEGRWFAREDGNFLYPIPLNLRSPRDSLLDGVVPQPDYRAGTEPYTEWMRRCGQAGITLVRPWIAPGFLGLEWNRTWRGYHGLGQYHLENAWRIDRLLELAEANNVLVELALWQHGPWMPLGDGDSQWQDNPYSKDLGGMIDHPAQAPFDSQVRRLHLQMARYAAARWGADPQLFGWTLWIEVDAVANRASTADWHADLAGELARRSWGRQPVSAEFRSGTGDPAVWNLPDIAYTQLAAYANPGATVDILAQRAKTLASYAKPGFIEEYAGRWNGSPPRQLALDIHEGLWASWGLDVAAAPSPWWWNLIFAHGLERWHRRFADWISDADLRGASWRTGVANLPSGALATFRIGPTRAWLWLKPRTGPPDGFDPLSPAPSDWFAADPARTIDLTPLNLPAGRWRTEVWDTWTDAPPDIQTLTIATRPVLLPLPKATRDVGVRLFREE